MTLDELAAQAKGEIIPVKERIAQLKRLAKNTDNLGERTRLYQRIAKLEQVLADLSETAYTLEHYYERSDKS